MQRDTDARHQGMLLGYIVFMVLDEDATIVDLMGKEGSEVFETLLSQLMILLQKRQVVIVNAPLIKTHAWKRFLGQQGFRPRDLCPIVFCRASQMQDDGAGFQNTNWLIMQGDRDS